MSTSRYSEHEALELCDLSVESLPSDAWETWGKKGGVCFAYKGEKTLKIFLANPIDQSVYHVVDFGNSRDQHRPNTRYAVGCTLVGSKIYVLCGYHYQERNCSFHEEEEPCLEVRYWELSTGSTFDWERGADLNSHKHNPLMFSLAGSLYVLSVGKDCCDPFEVLMKGLEDRWQVLKGVPDMFTRGGTFYLGSTIYGKRILVFVRDLYDMDNYLLFTYNAESDSWVSKRVTSRYRTLPDLEDFDIFQAKSFVINCGGYHVGNSMLRPLGLEEVVAELTCPCEKIKETYIRIGEEEYKRVIRDDEIYGQRGDVEPIGWHILPLGDKNFCLLSLYADQMSRHEHGNLLSSWARRGTGPRPHRPWKYYVRFNTFVLLMNPSSSDATKMHGIPDSDADESDADESYSSDASYSSDIATRIKQPSDQSKPKIAPYQYKIENLEMKYIDIAIQEKLHLQPYDIVSTSKM